MALTGREDGGVQGLETTAGIQVGSRQGRLGRRRNRYSTGFDKSIKPISAKGGIKAQQPLGSLVLRITNDSMHSLDIECLAFGFALLFFVK